MSTENHENTFIPSGTPTHEKDVIKYWFVFYKNQLLTKVNNEKAILPISKNIEELGIIPVRTQYLGLLGTTPCYSVEVDTDISSTDFTFEELRSLYGLINEDEFLVANKASQIVTWDRTNQFCGCCGHETYTIHGEYAKKCTNCGFTIYPRISPAVITAIFKDDKILLAHNNSFRENMYSLVAGFIEPGETLEDGVKREIFEEVGIKVKNVKYFESQPWPFPNSLMIGFTAEYESGEISEDGVEITHADWFTPENLPDLPPKISIARTIIDWYIKEKASIS